MTRAVWRWWFIICGFTALLAAAIYILFLLGEQVTVDEQIRRDWFHAREGDESDGSR